MHRFPKVACLLPILGITLSGCLSPSSAPPKGSFQLEVEQIVSTKDLVIVRLHLVFSGAGKVGIYEEGDREEASFSPDKETGLAECDVLLVADLVGSGESSKVKWLHRIQGDGVAVGGPAIYTVNPEQTLKDLLQIKINSGEYVLDSELELAVFEDRTLHMKVRPLPFPY